MKPPPIRDQSESSQISQSQGFFSKRLERLPPEIDGAIAAAIAIYRATATGSSDTTVGNTLAALRELEKAGKSYKKAVALLADDRSGIDYVTRSLLRRKNPVNGGI
jgi:hypothetical protein